jgi:hypothetical protein
MGMNRDRHKREIFNERYRVIAVSAQNLILRGEQSGKVLTISAAEYGAPITQEEYPVGKLVALSDPSRGPEN